MQGRTGPRASAVAAAFREPTDTVLIHLRLPRDRYRAPQARGGGTTRCVALERPLYHFPAPRRDLETVLHMDPHQHRDPVPDLVRALHRGTDRVRVQLDLARLQRAI